MEIQNSERKPNSLINSLKRLERIGDSESQAMRKIFLAASEVAEFVSQTVSVAVALPEGYTMEEIEGKRYLKAPTGNHLNVQNEMADSAKVQAPTREDVLEFSKHIANGWLDAVAAQLENETTENRKALRQIQSKLQEIEL